MLGRKCNKFSHVHSYNSSFNTEYGIKTEYKSVTGIQIEP